MKLRDIGENLYYAVAIAAILVGGVKWLTYIEDKTDANAQAISKIESKQSTIDEIHETVAVIKERVDNIQRILKQGEP